MESGSTKQGNDRVQDQHKPVGGSNPPRGGGVFPSTRYSLIERMRDGGAPARSAAFGEIVTGYWKPVYTHLRVTWRLSPEDAQDLTQAFFTEAFEKAWLDAYDPRKARFRTFIRLVADRMVMNSRQSASRLKRGGGRELLPLDFDGAERDVLTRSAATPPEAEELFRQEFVRALFGRALDEVRAECEARGKTMHFRLFERYDIDRAGGESYSTLAREFGLSESRVTNYLAEVRRMFREHAIESLRALSGSREHFRSEARELFGLEVE